MLHARTADIRCDDYCSTFWDFGLELNMGLNTSPIGVLRTPCIFFKWTEYLVVVRYVHRSVDRTHLSPVDPLVLRRVFICYAHACTGASCAHSCCGSATYYHHHNQPQVAKLLGVDVARAFNAFTSRRLHIDGVRV